PLMLYVLTGGFRGRELPEGKRWNVTGTIRVALAAIVAALAVNLPFMLAGFRGWQASFTFQELRQVDITTNSIWFWAFRPESEPADAHFQHLVGVLSPIAVLLSFALACAIGWWRFRKEGSYSWMAVSAAMLCGFLLL